MRVCGLLLLFVVVCAMEVADDDKYVTITSSKRTGARGGGGGGDADKSWGDERVAHSLSDDEFPFPHREDVDPKTSAGKKLKPGCYVEAWSKVMFGVPLTGLKDGLEHASLAYFRVPDKNKINVQLYCNHGTCPGEDPMVLRLRAYQPDLAKCPLFLLSCDMLEEKATSSGKHGRSFTYAGMGGGVGKHVCSTDNIVQLLSFFTHGTTDVAPPPAAAGATAGDSKGKAKEEDKKGKGTATSMTSSYDMSNLAASRTSDKDLQHNQPPLVTSLSYDICTRAYPFFLHDDLLHFLKQARPGKELWPADSGISGIIDSSNDGSLQLVPYFPQVYACFTEAYNPVFEYLEDKQKVVLRWQDATTLNEHGGHYVYDVPVPSEVEPYAELAFVWNLRNQAFRSMAHLNVKSRHAVDSDRQRLGPMLKPLANDPVLARPPFPVPGLTDAKALSYIPWAALKDLQRTDGNSFQPGFAMYKKTRSGKRKKQDVPRLDGFLQSRVNPAKHPMTFYPNIAAQAEAEQQEFEVHYSYGSDQFAPADATTSSNPTTGLTSTASSRRRASAPAGNGDTAHQRANWRRSASRAGAAIRGTVSGGASSRSGITSTLSGALNGVTSTLSGAFKGYPDTERKK